VLETAEEIDRLQQLLDRSAAGRPQGPAFQAWLDAADAVGARITADKMFTFAANT